MNAPPAALLDARYRLGPVIARGGMSIVYRGHDTRLDRPVAVKVVDSRLADDPSFLARFEREARSAARIDHPNVIDVHDQGRHLERGRHGMEQVLFLVMELVEGGTLRDLLRAKGQLGVPGAVVVMEQVLAGLAEAHRLGLVHRDVKPENVLIGYDGAVKVADFGLVVAAAQAGHSHAGMILGTVAYLSPEQVTTGKADARSDVYSAGVVLYELLTGKAPFAGDTAISVAYQHVTSRVPVPSALVGDIPPELDALVAAATDPDPEKRPADAAAMLARLREVATQLELPRIPVPVPDRPPVDVQETIPHGMPAVGHPSLPGRNHTRAMPMPPPPPGSAAVGAGMGPGMGAASGSHTLLGLPREPEAPARSWRRPALIGTAILLVLALVGVGGWTAWWQTTGRWTATPTLIGVDQAAAASLIAEADLVLGSVTTVLDDAVPEGAVISSDPPADARLLRGATVNLTVSTGRPSVPMISPGTAVDDAEDAIRASGLNPVRSNSAREYSDTVPQGAVTRTDPAGGTAVAIGSSVTLVVSRGEQPPPQVAVPTLVGGSLASAQAALAGIGLTLNGQSQNGNIFSQPDDQRQVIQQSPDPGTAVNQGTAVTVVVIF